MLRMDHGVTQRGTRGEERQFPSLDWEIVMVQGGPRVTGKSQPRGGRDVSHTLGHPRPSGDLGGLCSLSLNLFIRLLNTSFIWGCYKHPQCPQQFALDVFIDSFSYNFPQKPVVKLHSLFVIDWSCSVDYPSHTGLISGHISLEIHL